MVELVFAPANLVSVIARIAVSIVGKNFLTRHIGRVKHFDGVLNFNTSCDTDSIVMSELICGSIIGGISTYRNLLASSAMILNLFNLVNCTSRSNKHGSTTSAISVRIFNAAMAWKSAACKGKKKKVKNPTRE
jgi:hypothetical protein